ncbi:MAG: gliding motility protein GldM [Bacteroidia bacterium]|nr:gliding motility protein GldM [Bacteroidia bacterium]
MALPQEPRQKMINIMYLVLTALLALNVSVQILNAFIAVDNGLVSTNKNFDKKNANTMELFSKAYEQDPLKTKPFYDKAKEVQKWSKDLCNYIDSLKTDLKAETDHITKKQADTIKLIEINAKDNFDIPTHILINDAVSEDGSKGKAHELKVKIAEYRKKIMGLFDPGRDSVTANIGLKTPNVYSDEEERKVTWEVANFYERPLVAEICLLSKEQNDVKNVEATMEAYLLSSVNASNFKFDKITKEVVPFSNYVLLGDSFKAQIFTAAYSSTQNPRIIVGAVDTLTGKPLPGGKVDSVRVANGMGYYAVKTDHEGSVRYAGSITIQKPDGSFQTYPFVSSYLVAKPAVVISPTKMNVFYISVDNPVEISAPGIPDDAIRPSFQGPGSISGSKGKYIVRVTGGAGTTCKIGVSAKLLDGTTRSFPPQEFRIKKVPDPIFYVAGKKGDINITKAVLINSPKVEARMENFDFDLHYDVISFQIVVTAGGYSKIEQSNSDRLTPSMISLIKQSPSGNHIIFQKVSVKGPDTRPISGANVTIN